MMANWVDGYAILTGGIEDILSFITTRTMQLRMPVHAKVEGSTLVFPDDFTPEDLYVLDTDRAFIGFERKHDIKKTDTPGIYEVSVVWDQAHGLKTNELVALAQRNNLAIEAEGIVFELELKEHVIVNKHGEILFYECIEYNHEDYDPYDDYKKIK